MLIQSSEATAILALFRPEQHDRHCQARREAIWLQRSHADASLRAEAVRNWAANLIADYMTHQTISS